MANGPCRSPGWWSKAVKDICRKHVHLDFLAQLQAILPANAQASSWEMENLMGSNFRLPCRRWIGIMSAARPRIPNSMKMDRPFSFSDLCSSRWTIRSAFRCLVYQEGYGPVTVIAWWERGLSRTHLSGDQLRIAR